MILAEFPWVGLLWDEVNQRMLTAPENQKVARRILYYSIGGDLIRFRTDEASLRQEYAGLLNTDPEQVAVVRYV
jgi:hypothetical protein